MSEENKGRGLPVGWGWTEPSAGECSNLFSPNVARSYGNAFAIVNDDDGTWTIYPDGGDASSEEGAATARPGETLLAAAKREAEAALWRVDGFGMGEVRGARMMLGQQPTIVGTDRLFCLMDLPGLWRVIRVPLNSEAIVEVDAVRAPAEPIRIAVGAPDPLGLGVGEHDAPGGGPCSCGAWHRGAGAEAAPLPLAAMTGCDSHSVDPRAGCAECNAIAEREEPSFRTGCAEHLRIWGRGCETCDRLRSGGEPAPLPPKPWREQTDAEQVDATKARARELGFVIRDPRDKKPMPSEPPAPTDDPGDELARLLPFVREDVGMVRGEQGGARIRRDAALRLASACELLLGERERLTRDLGVSDAMVSRATRDLSDARARVAELEATAAHARRLLAEREDRILRLASDSADIDTREIIAEHMARADATERRIATLEATPPGASVAALLRAVESVLAFFGTVEWNDMSSEDGACKAMDTLRLITARLTAALDAARDEYIAATERADIAEATVGRLRAELAEAGERETRAINGGCDVRERDRLCAELAEARAREARTTDLYREAVARSMSAEEQRAQSRAAVIEGAQNAAEASIRHAEAIAAARLDGAREERRLCLFDVRRAMGGEDAGANDALAEAERAILGRGDPGLARATEGRQG